MIKGNLTDYINLVLCLCCNRAENVISVLKINLHASK